MMCVCLHTLSMPLVLDDSCMMYIVSNINCASISIFSIIYHQRYFWNVK